MKRLALIFLFISAVLNPFNVWAVDQLLQSGQVIDSDFIQTGQSIQIDGEIKGDAFLAGGLVTINGKVDGDLFVFGGKVNVNGQVGNNIRILGGDVTVNGPVGRNTLLVCGNCTLTKQASISGSLLTAGASLDLAASKIGRGFRFIGNRLYLNSEIANEAFVVADQQFLLGPNASVSGDLKYTGNQEAVLQPGATVAGKITYQKNNQGDNTPRIFGARTILQSYQKIKPLTDIFGLLVSSLVGFVLLGLFPKGFEKVSQAIDNQPYASLAWGLIVALIVPIIVILFALTLVGIPVSLLVLLLSYVSLTIAQYLTAFFVGRKILYPQFGERRGWALLLGLILLFLLNYVPILGGLIKLILILFSLGAVVLAYRHKEIYVPRPLTSFGDNTSKIKKK